MSTTKTTPAAADVTAWMEYPTDTGWLAYFCWLCRGCGAKLTTPDTKQKLAQTVGSCAACGYAHSSRELQEITRDALAFARTHNAPQELIDLRAGGRLDGQAPVDTRRRWVSIPATLAAKSSAPVTHWRSADGQGVIDMTGATTSEALAELLGQCGSAEQRDGILAGTFEGVAGPGRPPESPTGERRRPWNVSIAPSAKARVEAEAARRGVSPSALVEEWVLTRAAEHAPALDRAAAAAERAAIVVWLRAEAQRCADALDRGSYDAGIGMVVLRARADAIEAGRHHPTAAASHIKAR